MIEKSVVNKQQICPALFNTALQKLAQINPFYSNIIIHNEWEYLIEQSDLVLWKLLTDKNAEIRLIVMMIQRAMVNLMKKN